MCLETAGALMRILGIPHSKRCLKYPLVLLTAFLTRFSSVSSKRANALETAAGKRPAKAPVRQHGRPVAAESLAQKARHRPLDLERALDKRRAWLGWIERPEKVAPRDKKRMREAFDLLDRKDHETPYGAFLRGAERVGGFKLVLLLALAVGKAAFKSMKAATKEGLPSGAAERQWHQSNCLRKLVRAFR